MTAPGEGAGDRTALRCLAGFLLVSAIIITGVSYIDEDAFISFRTVENFVDGYGLRWNTDERVQSFTNPLWVLLLIPLRAVLGDVIWASYALSIVCSTAAIAVVARELRKEPLLFGLALFLPLFLSRAFTDYTNSGLENPLTLLLLALFATRFLRIEEKIPWRRLTLLTALLAVNRLDAVLLTAPAMAWLYFTNFRKAEHKQILLGSLPLIAWLLFSLFYFGMPFPNTKYAKLDAGFGVSVYIKFGLYYLLDIIRNDTWTFTGLLGGFTVTALAARKWLQTRDPAWGRLASLTAGAVVTSLYVLYIGGDFMAGRHWSSPFFLSVIVMAFALRQSGRATPLPLIGLVCVMLASRFAAEPILAERDTLKKRAQGSAIVRNVGIRDQRYNAGFYESLFGSLGPIQDHPWSKQGLEYREQAARARIEHPDERFVAVRGAAGKIPFFAGPDVVFIDVLAITDPLLARLPDADGKFLVAGHLDRHVPEGYVHARQTDSLEQMDPALQNYYRELRLITSGPLFDPARLTAILRFHLGSYDPFLAEYMANGYKAERKRAREQEKADRVKRRQAKPDAEDSDAEPKDDAN